MKQSGPYYTYEHLKAVSIYRDVGGGVKNWIGTYWPKRLGTAYCAELNQIVATTAPGRA